MKSERIETRKLNENDLVDVTEMGNILEIRFMSKKNRRNVIRRLENKEYLDLRTGEIKKCEKSEKRIDRINSLKSTFRKLRNIINTNVIEPTFCQWITLTYKENVQMTKYKKLYNDFQKFHKKYKYYMNKKGVQNFEYINIIEPQGRGSIHCHLIYIFDRKPPFVPNEKLREIWGARICKN